MGDKGNDRVKFPSVRALSQRNERLKTNEEAYPIEKTAVVSVIPLKVRWFDNETQIVYSAYKNEC